MTLVIADSAVAGQFRMAREPVELLATDGRLLGHFVPALDLSSDHQLAPQITEEELQRRERNGGGRSLAGILADPGTEVLKWDVIWLPDAEQELADAWLSARPGRVTRAAHLIDLQLQNDPEQAGQLFTNGRRSLLVPPLGVVYRVLKDVGRVEVLHVWRLPPGNGQAP